MAKRLYKLNSLLIIVLISIFSLSSSEAIPLEHDELIRVSNDNLNEVVTTNSPLFEGATEKEILTVLGYTKNGIRAKKDSLMKLEAFEKDFLSKEGYISWDEDIQRLSLSIAKDGTDKEKAFRIYEYVENMNYDHEKAEKIESREVRIYSPDNKSTLNSQNGICYDFASLYTSMLRSIGIKSKMVKGELDNSYHAWSEVFIDGKWIMVDPTAALFGEYMENHIAKFKY